MGTILCSDAGAVWACDCLHWMLSSLTCSNAGALVGHVRACMGCQVHGCALLELWHVSVLLTLVL